MARPAAAGVRIGFRLRCQLCPENWNLIVALFTARLHINLLNNIIIFCFTRPAVLQLDRGWRELTCKLLYILVRTTNSGLSLSEHRDWHTQQRTSLLRWQFQLSAAPLVEPGLPLPHTRLPGEMTLPTVPWGLSCSHTSFQTMTHSHTPKQCPYSASARREPVLQTKCPKLRCDLALRCVYASSGFFLIHWQAVCVQMNAHV